MKVKKPQPKWRARYWKDSKSDEQTITVSGRTLMEASRRAKANIKSKGHTFNLFKLERLS